MYFEQVEFGRQETLEVVVEQAVEHVELAVVEQVVV